MMEFSAPGKMILLGEYAVLDNAPALVCAVDLRATVKIEHLPGNEFVFSAPSLRLNELPFVILDNGHVRFDPSLRPEALRKLKLFSGIMEFVYQNLPAEKKRRGLRIEINTDAFYSTEFHSKLGFGSSAALCVALVKALISVLAPETEEARIFRLALNAHHHAQGKMGSGIDIAASYFGGFLKYQRIYEQDPMDKLPKMLAACPGLFFRPVFTGKSASTTKLVGGVKQLKEQQPQIYRQIMSRLKEISAAGVMAFEQKNVEQFLDRVRAFYSSLKDLGRQSAMPIISEVHQKLAELAKQHGAVYKPSGAGSGDIGLVFAANEQILLKTIAVIKEHGYLPLEVKVAGQGVRLEKSF